MSKTIQPRKARKALIDAPLHVRRKQIASHLSEELLLKYNRRRVPVITGDEVKILRGGHKGHTGKIVSVDTTSRKVVIEGVTHKKADGTDVPFPVHPSNLLITRLNLEDERRRTKLGAEAESAKAESGKAEAKKAEAKKPEAKKTEAKKAEAGKAESTKAAPETAEPSKEASE